jgi:SNF2 family DNA or RNA helicase
MTQVGRKKSKSEKEAEAAVAAKWGGGVDLDPEEEGEKGDAEEYFDEWGDKDVMNEGGKSTGKEEDEDEDIPNVVESKVGDDWWKLADVLTFSPSSSSSSTTSAATAATFSSSSACPQLHIGQQVRSKGEELSAFIHLSGKLSVFLNILMRSVKKKEKVLMFSQSLYTLSFVEIVLQSRDWGAAMMTSSSSPSSTTNTEEWRDFSRWRKGHEYLRIDGKVNATDRDTLIRKFNDKNSSCSLFLVSTKAGNMGINLQAASRVVIFDCSWNPANDLQAIYRAYRFGQTRNVFIYRLLELI